MAGLLVNCYLRFSKRYRVTAVKSTVKYGKTLLSLEIISGIGLEMGMLKRLPVVTVAMKNKTVTMTAMISIGLSEAVW
jgi:hypothetical protein